MVSSASDRRWEHSLPSIESGLFAAQTFDFRPPRFGVEPTPARGLGRLRRAARNGRLRGFADHLDQALARVLAVLLLAAVAKCRDHDHALAREPPPRDALEPCAHVVRQRRRSARVEAKLDGARNDLVSCAAMVVDPAEPSDVTPDPRARVRFIAEKKTKARPVIPK